MLEPGFFPIINPTHFRFDENFIISEKILAAGFQSLLFLSRGLSQKNYQKLIQEIYYLKLHNSFKLIIHNDLELAQMLEADGLHLSAKKAYLYSKARKILKPNTLLGTSVHCADEGIKKSKQGFDYLVLGSVFPTNKPNFYSVCGLYELTKLTNQTQTPVIAIGGIDAKNIDKIAKTKTFGFSSLGALEKSVYEPKKIKKLQESFLMTQQA